MALIKRRAKAEHLPPGSLGDPIGDAPEVTPLDAQAASLRLMGHELRTPLNAIIGFSDIIAAELYGPIPDPRYADHARMIRQSGMRLLDVVNRLVELSRLEAGAADLHLRPTRAHDVAEDAIRAVSNLAKERSVTVVCEIPDSVPRIRGDARALVTVLHNLLANAVEASPIDGVARLIVAAEDKVVRFVVRDEGNGVSAELLPRIIHPFVQGENALVRQTTGAGLGLPIALGLTKAMDGTLTLTSHPGEGLVATVTLPVEPA
jgi:signal transduction histidine kinase